MSVNSVNLTPASPGCDHDWRVVHYTDGEPVEWNQQGCVKCQADGPSDPLNANRWICGLPLAPLRY